MSSSVNDRLLRLATKVRVGLAYHDRYEIAEAIEEIARDAAQPLSDERDELRQIVVAFVQWMKMQRKEAPIKKAEAYLAKYPKP